MIPNYLLRIQKIRKSSYKKGDQYMAASSVTIQLDEYNIPP